MISPTLRIRVLFTALAGLFAFLPLQRAQAVLLQYEFRGTVEPGSTLDLGAGVVDLSNAPFVLTGNTISDVDLNAAGDQGLFSATSTYSFGGLGSFSTDAGGDFYFQVGAMSAFINGSGLTNLSLTAGFVAEFDPWVAGDANFGVVTGEHTYITSSQVASPRVISNLAGHSMSLNFTQTSVGYMNITAATSPVPESASMVIWVVGIACAGFVSYRRKCH